MPPNWLDRVNERLDALESAAAPAGCTCGIRPDVPAGPNHAAGCPMEVTAASMQILREMLVNSDRQRDEARRERDAWKDAAEARDQQRVGLREQLEHRSSQRDALQQQLDAMRAALAKYGRHLVMGCRSGCVCGLDLLLTGEATDALAAAGDTSEGAGRVSSDRQPTRGDSPIILQIARAAERERVEGNGWLSCSWILDVVGQQPEDEGEWMRGVG